MSAIGFFGRGTVFRARLSPVGVYSVGVGRQTAWLEFRNDGVLHGYETGSGWASNDEWLHPQSTAGAALYEVMFTLVSGDLTSAPQFGVWLPLSQSRRFVQDRAAIGHWPSTSRADIRQIGSSAIEVTGEFDVNALVQ